MHRADVQPALRERAGPPHRQSDPRIRRIFDLWKNTPALDSPLEKNQDLKSVMLEETPWLRQAQGESQARKNVGILFDSNRLDAESVQAMRQLAEAQLGDGTWPWFRAGVATNISPSTSPPASAACAISAPRSTWRWR